MNSELESDLIKFCNYFYGELSNWQEELLRLYENNPKGFRKELIKKIVGREPTCLLASSQSSKTDQ